MNNMNYNNLTNNNISKSMEANNVNNPSSGSSGLGLGNINIFYIVLYSLILHNKYSIKFFRENN